jgi:diaminopropionate ammonia-lyase
MSATQSTAGHTEEAVVVRKRAAGSLVFASPDGATLRFHASMPDYGTTPLRSAPICAERLGVAEVLVKDESSRLGLPSFKVLGASWAIHRALVERLGLKLDDVSTFPELVRRIEALRPLTLSAATDGNHGRAVARVAKLLGLAARVYVPEGTAQPRIAAIASEGAEVTVVAGGYAAAVARSAEDAGERGLVISDTSWPGYQDVPVWVVDGYSTVFGEVEQALVAGGHQRPEIVAIPIGVGALAAATVQHFWSSEGERPLLVGVEPTTAACVLRSVEAGQIVTLEGDTQSSIMAGLNCETPSLVAWPVVSAGIDVYVSIEDQRVPEAMRLLAQDGVVAGETGAAGLAAMLRLVDDPAPAPAPHLSDQTRLLLICTEGATDPAAYERLTGLRPEEVSR